MSKHQRTQLNPFTHFIVGGVAGATGTIVTFPLDFVKTQFQATTKRSILSCLVDNGSLVQRHGGTLLINNSIYYQYTRHLFNQEGGFKVFFRGITPALIGAIPTRAIMLASYPSYKNLCDKIPHLRSNMNATHFTSGALASITVSLLTSPIWTVKTKMQIEQSSRSTISTAHNIWKVNGCRGFYRGLSAAYAGSLEKGVYFLVYEFIKERLSSKQDCQQSLSFTSCSVASFTAAILSVPLGYPCEVVRTRMRKDCGQREYKTLLQSLLKIWREEKFTGLYGGLRPHLLKTIPAIVVTFLTYEAINSLLVARKSNMNCMAGPQWSG